MNDSDYSYVQTGHFVLIVVAGEPLALTLDEWREARERGRALLPVTAQASASAEDRIVDAAEASRLTGVPASWFEQAIREGRIPCLTFGKYKRLRLSEVLKACETRRLGDGKSSHVNFRLAGKQK